jgi:hypothetical protein
MELLYIWIEKYKNIERQGFNFSPLYDFEFTVKEGENGEIAGELIDHKTKEQREKLRKVY